jgi:hypothetical protein
MVAGEKLQSSEGKVTKGMAISMSMFVLAMSGAGRLVGGLLLTSAVIMVSVHQDLSLRVWIGAVFGFFMAIAFGISALVTAIA